jgi:hypothetical protein
MTHVAWTGPLCSPISSRQAPFLHHEVSIEGSCSDRAHPTSGPKGCNDGPESVELVWDRGKAHLAGVGHGRAHRSPGERWAPADPVLTGRTFGTSGPCGHLENLGHRRTARLPSKPWAPADAVVTGRTFRTSGPRAHPADVRHQRTARSAGEPRAARTNEHPPGSPGTSHRHQTPPRPRTVAHRLSVASRRRVESPCEGGQVLLEVIEAGPRCRRSPAGAGVGGDWYGVPPMNESPGQRSVPWSWGCSGRRRWRVTSRA